MRPRSAADGNGTSSPVGEAIVAMSWPAVHAAKPTPRASHVARSSGRLTARHTTRITALSSSRNWIDSWTSTRTRVVPAAQPTPSTTRYTATTAANAVQARRRGRDRRGSASITSGIGAPRV